MSASTYAVALRTRLETILNAWSKPAYVDLYAPNEETAAPAAGRVAVYWTIDHPQEELIDFAGSVAGEPEWAFELKEAAGTGLELWLAVKDSLMTHLRTYRNTGGSWFGEPESSDEFRDGGYLIRVVSVPMRHEEAAA